MTELSMVWDSPHFGRVRFGTVVVADVVRISDKVRVSQQDGTVVLYDGPADDAAALKAVADHIISTESGE